MSFKQLFFLLFFSDRNNCGRHYIRCCRAMNILIIEEDVSAERFQNLVFADATQEMGFIDSDIPFMQRPDDALVCRTVSSSNQKQFESGLVLQRPPFELLLWHGEEGISHLTMQGIGPWSKLPQVRPKSIDIQSRLSANFCTNSKAAFSKMLIWAAFVYLLYLCRRSHSIINHSITPQYYAGLIHLFTVAVNGKGYPHAYNEPSS